MSLRAKMDYNNEYNKRTYKSITLRFNKQTEAEVIEWLSEKDTTPYIRSLIRADMDRVIDSHDKTLCLYDYADEILHTPPHLVDDHKEGHDDIEKYPYEVMEQLPFYDKYVIAYCADLDQVRKTITDYCLKNSQVGEIYVCKRFMDSQGNIFGRRIRTEFINKEKE